MVWQLAARTTEEPSMMARRVSVRYNGSEEERYLGHEVGVNGDGSRSIRYDDGEEQQSVEARWVTYVTHVTAENAREGLAVEARVPDDSRVYPGVIARINDDGTFGIAFDDGDRLESVESRDIVTAQPPEKEARDEADDERQLWDAILEDENDDDEQVDLATKDGEEQPPGGLSPLSEREPLAPCSIETDHADHTMRDDEEELGEDEREDSLACDGARVEDTWGYADGERDDLGLGHLELGEAPEAPPALANHLHMLRTSLSAAMDAPPEMRLTKMQYEAATIEQARCRNELLGRTWESGETRCEWGASSKWCVAHVDALLQLRMRSVAVCRVRFGSTSREMVRCVVDLAGAYAQAGLWPQAASHADRALELLATIQVQNDADNEERPPNRDVARVFELLGKAALSHGGCVPWGDLVFILDAVPALAEQPWGVRDGAVDNPPTWAGAVGFLRKHHRGLASAVRKVERSLPAAEVALLLLVFEAAASMQGAPAESGAASPVSLRAAIARTPAAATAFFRTGFARWLAGRCRRQLEALSSRTEDIPLTWEEAVCALAGDRDRNGDLAELRAAALSISGRAHAAAGRLVKARNLLDAALVTSETAATHAALADVLVAEHSARAKAAEERAHKTAEEWLTTDEGHRLWRSEVKRLVAEMRITGTPGVAQLTRHEIECRARDVLLNARIQYILGRRDKGSPPHPKLDDPSSKLLDLAKSHLEAALARELATYGRHKNNAHAAVALAALGNLAVIAGDREKAIARLAEALAAMLAATDDCHHANSADVAVRLGRLLRKYKSRRAEAAECLAAAADFFLSLARRADADVGKYVSLQSLAGAASESRRDRTATYSSRVELATEARNAAARKARALWTDVTSILVNDGRGFAGSHDANVANALQRAHAASCLADGDTATASLKALRKLAAFQTSVENFDAAAASYLQLHNLALRVGAADVARKAARARSNAIAEARRTKRQRDSL